MLAPTSIVAILSPKEVPTLYLVKTQLCNETRQHYLRMCTEPDGIFAGVNPDVEFQRKAGVTNAGVTNAGVTNVRGNNADESIEPDEMTEDDNAHDAYFGIKRIRGNAANIFADSISWAYWLLKRDAMDSPFTVAPARLDSIRWALEDLMHHVVGEAPAKPRRQAAWPQTASGYNSMQRWIRGHQLFAVLTQGLIFSFRELSGAIAEGRKHETLQFLDLTVSLLEGSAASLEFTGDFPPEEYRSKIRPTMVPPHVPETFSGLLSIDHRCFVQILKEMRPTIESLQQIDGDLHTRLRQAVGGVYDSHKHVCNRFVGTNPSLMMAQKSAHSGGDQIERFKTLRMKVFDSKISTPEKQLVRHQ